MSPQRSTPSDNNDQQATLAQLATRWLGQKGRAEEGHLVLEQGENEDKSPGSALAVEVSDQGQPSHIVITIRHPDLYDDAQAMEEQTAEWLKQALDRVLDQPEGRQLQSIEVRQQLDYSGDLEHQGLVDHLASKDLRALRKLRWGYDHGTCFVLIPKLEALLEGMPQIEELMLQGNWAEENEELKTTGLRALGLNALGEEEMDAIKSLDLSTVESLTLWLYDHENEGAEELFLEDLEALWETPLPRLKELTLCACEFSGELLTSLPEAAIFPQLERLGLVDATNTGSFLGEEEAEALLSPAYRGIGVIDVTGAFSYPTGEASPLLARLVSESCGRIFGRAGG